MCSKYIILLLLVVLVHFSVADDLTSVSRGKKHKYHHLYHSGLYYLAFLAIKAKIIFSIGLGIAAFFTVGKFFALIKYATLIFAKNKNCEHKAPVIIDRPYFNDHHFDQYNGPDEHYGHEEYDHPPYREYETTPPTKGRSMKENILDNINYVKDIIKSIDLTEMTFEQMKIDSDDCKRKFVCEIDYKARSNTIVGLGLYMFTDMGLEKYRTNSSQINSMRDCVNLYPNCTTTPATY